MSCVAGWRDLVELGRQVADVADKFCVGVSQARRLAGSPPAVAAAKAPKLLANSSKPFLILALISLSSSRSLRSAALSSSTICWRASLTSFRFLPNYWSTCPAQPISPSTFFVFSAR